MFLKSEQLTVIIRYLVPTNLLKAEKQNLSKSSETHDDKQKTRGDLRPLVDWCASGRPTRGDIPSRLAANSSSGKLNRWRKSNASSWAEGKEKAHFKRFRILYVIFM